MDLNHLAWGDVLVDTGEVLVVAAELDGERVVVKRWGDGVLDAEQVARHLLRAAGVAAAQLLGDGPGWLVLEDLDDTMWRPAHPDDLAGAGTQRALARWFAAAHRVDPDDLAPDLASQVLSPGLVALASTALDDQLGEALPDAVAAWWQQLAELPASLVVGACSVSQLRVVGAGLDAMPTQLDLCGRGVAATDLALLRSLLGGPHDPAWQVFRDEYRAVAQVPVTQHQVDAAHRLGLAMPVVATTLAGGQSDPQALEALRGAMAE